MEILVLGGTKYFGIHMVEELIKKGHNVTIATRGITKDTYGNSVRRLVVERNSAKSMAEVFSNMTYDVVCDNIAYCSNDVKYALDSIKCKRYVMTSSMSVYDDLHVNTMESDFNPFEKPLKWCDRADYPYDEVKRLAECALFQAYPLQNSAAVRFPFVIGTDDYTKRLYFYIEHVVKEIPMFIDNIDAQMEFVSSDEAGRFLAFLAEQECTGAFNGSNTGTISLREIIAYVEEKTGRRTVLSKAGDNGPYNGAPDYSLNTRLASEWKFDFSPLKSWIYDLIDKFIQEATT
ncbi:Rossmann-fold NAD(P)-binding domain-containing protein [Lacrimispora celerecrescens]|uniref:UDP-glucose 4-epimerase n=1 Tax=[Clostridium] celerecrescens 18A TaxID=1286362 RepID=A0A2M8Z740_9FIRM|nr:NAD-dependent epimerase/dehydratase family protein [Lacrimispora celerecrescens]PJJ29249.1 nucleoside-diphosphate-sugar epimerase [[Clostridium] celerecrescens 18A]